MMNFYLKSTKLKINIAAMCINFVLDYLTILFAFPQNCSEILLQDDALLKKIQGESIKGQDKQQSSVTN